jgi:transcriptional regulator with XRE-family HTH domain
MNNLYKFIGKKIRDLRSTHKGKGISQEELAQAVGTTPNTISRWETAAYKVSVGDLEQLSRFFAVPITEFFPSLEPNVTVNALLSATGDLDDKDIEELRDWALFRKARRALKEASGAKKPAETT